MENFDVLLNELYYKQKNYDGVVELTRKARLLNKDIKKEDVKAWLNKQETHQQTTAKDVGKKKQFLPIYSNDHFSFQIDLTFLPKYQAKNDKYYVLFTAININTRYAYCYWSRDKNTDTIIGMLKAFLDNALEIHTISCDFGSEFIAKDVKLWFEENEIEVYYIKDEGHSKLGIINRFHRTLKEKLNKSFIATGSVRWIDSIDEIIKNYNNTINRGIGFTPREASKSLVESYLINKAKDKTNLINNKFETENDDIIVGNKCRVLNTSAIFDKMKIKYSDVYTIIKVEKNTVDIENDIHIIRKILKKNIKIISNETQVDNNPNDRVQVEREYNQDRLHRRLDVELNNIVDGKRVRKVINRLNL